MILWLARSFVYSFDFWLSVRHPFLKYVAFSNMCLFAFTYGSLIVLKAVSPVALHLPLKPQFYYTYLACPLGACTLYI